MQMNQKLTKEEYMKYDGNKYKCCLCGDYFTGYGNNPAPVKNEGRCCDQCNIQVILERLKITLTSE